MRRAISGRTAHIAMLLAIAFMLVAPDHWDIPWPGGHGHGESHGHAEDQAQHARHCHGDAATCTDLPLTTFGGVATLREWLLTGPLVFGQGRAVAALAAPPADALGDSPTPPPRPAATL